MNDDIVSPALRLIDAFAVSLKGEGMEEVKTALARQDLSPAAAIGPSPSSLPAVRFFPECVAASMFVAPGFAAALAEIAEFLHWKQNPNYSDRVMGKGYMDNYAYAEIIGPHGFFAGDDFLLGILLLGPAQFYRDHHHPAPELYWLLTGPSEWRKGRESFETQPAGATIWHPPHLSHATRTGVSPLLAAWAWTRDVGTAARLLESE